MSQSMSWETRGYRNLGTKTFWIFLLQRIPATIVLSALLLFLLYFGGSAVSPEYQTALTIATIILFFTTLLTAVFTFVVSWLVYITYKFQLGEHALKIERGIFNKEEVSIPYRQVQNINIRRSIMHRMLGVSRLVILTAGEETDDSESESEGILPVLDKSLAEEIQGELLRRAHWPETGARG